MEKALFTSIIGYEDIKLELSRLVDRLKNPDKYAAMGVTAPHGLMLHGAPGVGKSTLAHEFLDVCERRVFVCRKDKPNGEFVKEIVRVFDEAAEAQPSMVLLDDIDKFTNEDEPSFDAEEFATVQACIDRVKDKAVFVVATANKLYKLPQSLVRAGRFDHVLEVSCPKGKDAEAIVSYYLSKKPYVADVDVKRIARLLDGRSCAELEMVINQAGMYAVYDGREQVEMRDIVKSILRVVFQAPEKADAYEHSLPVVACHEAGHALVAELLEPDSVDLVTVLDHDSRAAGVTSLYRAEEYFYSKRLMDIRVMCLLGGKAATEICFGEVDTGVRSDLQRVFDIVHRFVDDYASYGFSQFVFTASQSDSLLERRDTRVAAEVERYYAQTKELLVKHREQLDTLTKRLVEEKTLLGDEVHRIVHGEKSPKYSPKNAAV